MRIGTLRVSFMVLDAQNLKEKRRVLRSLKDRLMNTFNVSVAEIGSNDSWQMGEIGIATVANDGRFVNSVLEKIEDFLESENLIRVVDVDLEII